MIAWGRFEELSGEAAVAGMRKLLERFAPLTTSRTSRPSHGQDAGGRHAVLFRIVLTEKTGRFEEP